MSLDLLHYITLCGAMQGAQCTVHSTQYTVISIWQVTLAHGNDGQDTANGPKTTRHGVCCRAVNVSGVHRPLSDQIAEIIQCIVHPGKTRHCCTAGCGYTLHSVFLLLHVLRMLLQCCITIENNDWLSHQSQQPCGWIIALINRGYHIASVCISQSHASHIKSVVIIMF